MIFGIKEKSIILTQTIGYYFKYTPATEDLCAPGSYMLCENQQSFAHLAV